MNKYIYTDGESTKSIDLPNYPDEAFTWYSNPPDTKDDDLYAKVAAVYRAMNLNAQAVADLPFALVNANKPKAQKAETKADEDYDNSDDWQNKIGILPNPKELFRLWRLSLGFSNTFYGRITNTNASKKQIFYCVPSSIQPLTNRERGMLIGFKRGTKEEWKIAEAGKTFVYGFRLDHTTELLPSKHTEFKALCNAAGILHYSDVFTSNFYRRGGVKPTLIAMKGLIANEKKEDMQKNWSNFLRGIGKAWENVTAKIFQAEAMDIQAFGDGLGDLKETPVYMQAIENVAIASGIPLSLLLANSANYATALSENVHWFRTTVTPWANFIADKLNEQLFIPMGYKLEFRPEVTDPEQEDEVQRAQAYKTYVDSGVKPSVAAQIVGVEMPHGVEYEDLDQMKEENQEKAMEIAQAGKSPQDSGKDDKEDEKKKPFGKWIPTVEEVKELARWQGVALRKFKRGEKVFQYEYKYTDLPVHVREGIEYTLANAQNAEDVKSAFELQDFGDGFWRITNEMAEDAVIKDSAVIKDLAEAMNKLAEAVGTKDIV